jgi:desulfoferrodoxin (superoxide reductase-like protein)
VTDLQRFLAFGHTQVAARKATLQAVAAECAAIETQHGPPLTAAAPGQGAGKEAKHVPAVSVSAQGSSLTGARSVTVSVPHGMDEKHFIERVNCGCFQSLAHVSLASLSLSLSCRS